MRLAAQGIICSEDDDEELVLCGQTAPIDVVADPHPRPGSLIADGAAHTETVVYYSAVAAAADQSRRSKAGKDSADDLGDRDHPRPTTSGPQRMRAEPGSCWKIMAMSSNQELRGQGFVES